MVLYYAGKYTVHHQIAPESLGEVTLAGRFDTIFWRRYILATILAIGCMLMYPM